MNVPILGECYVERKGEAYHITPLHECIWPDDLILMDAARIVNDFVRKLK